MCESLLIYVHDFCSSLDLYNNNIIQYTQWDVQTRPLLKAEVVTNDGDSIGVDSNYVTKLYKTLLELKFDMFLFPSVWN
jgi:hypothetical protein